MNSALSRRRGARGSFSRWGPGPRCWPGQDFSSYKSVSEARKRAPGQLLRGLMKAPGAPRQSFRHLGCGLECLLQAMRTEDVPRGACRTGSRGPCENLMRRHRRCQSTSRATKSPASGARGHQFSSVREAHPSNFASSARPRAGIKDASLARSTATYSIPFAVCQRRHSCPICFLAVIARDAHARWRALKLHASRPLIAAWRALSGRTCAPPLLRARQGRALVRTRARDTDLAAKSPRSFPHVAQAVEEILHGQSRPAL